LYSVYSIFIFSSAPAMKNMVNGVAKLLYHRTYLLPQPLPLPPPSLFIFSTASVSITKLAHLLSTLLVSRAIGQNF